jgi:hypothetical protein
MSDSMNYDNVPDRRPHVYTVGMDGTDQPLPMAGDPVFRACDRQVADACFPPGNDRYTVRITAIQIAPHNEPIHSEMATTISIDDECSGEFVRIEQSTLSKGSVRLDPNEWPVVRDAINWMAAQCRGGNK